MKSRTSSFDTVVFRKNLTRFAPSWGLYSVLMLMILVILIDNGSRWFARNVCDLVNIMAIFTPCYALLCAQLLFGDLYNTRMCNALHALPLRRETWFVTHVLSGFVFHLIPTLLFTVFGILYTNLACQSGDWLCVAAWFLGVNLQFACFFGIAVFSAFCVGSRFAQAVIYSILNTAALIVGWLADTIFIPMYYGIRLNLDPILYFSPIGQMMEEPFLSYARDYISEDLFLDTLSTGDCFHYYFLAAAAGLALIFLALYLYRRRKLESAGDFMAVKGLEPVFLVVYTIVIGTLFQFITDDLIGMESFFFLFLGLAVGWFTGKMLLERSPRVFRWNNISRCGILMAVCGLILWVAALDPFGIECWLPEPEEVESVTLQDGYSGYNYNGLTLDSPEDIARIIAIQERTIRDHRQNLTPGSAFQQTYQELIEPDKYTPPEPHSMNFSTTFTLTYQLKNGRTVKRYYAIWMGDEDGAYLRTLFTSPLAVFGYDRDTARFLAENTVAHVSDTWEGHEINFYSPADLSSLYEAILADCQAGNMARRWDFHQSESCLYWIHFGDQLDINVFPCAENTLNWLRAHGFDVDAIIEKYN